jgi:hypothetical protein
VNFQNQERDDDGEDAVAEGFQAVFVRKVGLNIREDSLPLILDMNRHGGLVVVWPSAELMRAEGSAEPIDRADGIVAVIMKRSLDAFGVEHNSFGRSRFGDAVGVEKESLAGE